VGQSGQHTCEAWGRFRLENRCIGSARGDGNIVSTARVLRPGGRLAVIAPTAGRVARLLRVLPNTGVHLSGEDELGDILEDDGFIGVRAKSLGTIQWVRAKRGSHCDASLAAFR
jgi:hypothetical protein